MQATLPSRKLEVSWRNFPRRFARNSQVGISLGLIVGAAGHITFQLPDYLLFKISIEPADRTSGLSIVPAGFLCAGRIFDL